MIDTDIQSLLAVGINFQDIVEFIKNPLLLHKKIQDLELSTGTVTDTFYQQFTKGLARFMVREDTKNAMLALNAARIYQLHQQINGEEYIENAPIIAQLDALVSLLALQRVADNQKELALEVIEEEMAVDVNENLFTTIIEQHQQNIKVTQETNFANNPLAMIKGYTRSSVDSDIELFTAPMSKKNQLIKAGYTFHHQLPDIPGVTDVPMGFFTNPYAPEPERTPGILPYTGVKSKGMTLFEILSQQERFQIQNERGRMVGDPKQIKPIIDAYIQNQIDLLNNQLISGKLSKKTQLIPLINNAGEIYDFRVVMPTVTQEKLLKPNKTYDHVMSQLEMHYIDRKNSVLVEKESIGYLVDIINNEYKGPRDKRFVNILDSKHYDRYFLPLTPSIKDRIRENAIETKAGPVFPVKVDELHIIFGNKQLSVSLIPGFEKMPVAARKAVVGLEQALIGLTKIAVTTIVIRMPEVLQDNIFSNVLILMANGMSPQAAYKEQINAMKDLREWKNNTTRMIELYYEMRANNFKDKRKMSEYKALARSLETSPIRELMDKHLFTAMVEEIHINENSVFDKWAKNFDEQAQKHLPESVVNFAKLTYLSKSTAPFQAMQEFFQMSDFVARVALNNHLKKTKISRDQRMKIVYDTFVLYDVPSNSRVLNYLNKVGTILFINYFLKIPRASWNTAKRQPANILFLLGMQEAIGVDLPDIYDSTIVTGRAFPMTATPSDILETVLGLHGVNIVDDIID